MVTATRRAVGDYMFTLAAIIAGVGLLWQTPLPAAQGEASPGDFVWHDLVTDDPVAARTFYSALFGWKFGSGEGVDPGYTMITHNSRPIGGVVKRRETGDKGPAQWLSYVVVKDVDRASASFAQAGGRVLREPVSARKELRVAAVADPQGAPLGLASRGPKVVATGDTAMNDWLWMEYVARDPDGALSFYGQTLGYRHEISDTHEGFVYHVLSTDRPRAGLFKTLWGRENSAWLPYVRVADPAAMAVKAQQLGGTVVIPSSPRVRNGSLVIILDPAGAPLALQKFPFERPVGGTP